MKFAPEGHWNYFAARPVAWAAHTYFSIALVVGRWAHCVERASVNAYRRRPGRGRGMILRLTGYLSEAIHKQVASASVRSARVSGWATSLWRGRR